MLYQQRHSTWAKDIASLGESPALVVMDETTRYLKVVGSNPSTVYWMDIFHIDLL